MMEITLDELIKRNTDYSKMPYTLSLVQPEKEIKFDDWNDKDGKLQVLLPKKKGMKILHGRGKLASLLAKEIGKTKAEIEDIIEMDGCSKINSMSRKYKCCYLNFDQWFVAEISQ